MNVEWNPPVPQRQFHVAPAEPEWPVTRRNRWNRNRPKAMPQLTFDAVGNPVNRYAPDNLEAPRNRDPWAEVHSDDAWNQNPFMEPSSPMGTVGGRMNGGHGFPAPPPGLNGGHGFPAAPAASGMNGGHGFPAAPVQDAQSWDPMTPLKVEQIEEGPFDC